MGVDPEIAPTTSASKAPEVSSQYDRDYKKRIVEENAHFTAAELEKYGQTQRGLSPRHVQLMAIGGTQTYFPSMLLFLYR
jgi:amino acid transporter